MRNSYKRSFKLDILTGKKITLINSLMKQKISLIEALLFFTMILGPQAWAQSVNYTIWQGTATVKIPALTQYRDGRPQSFPTVPSGLTMTLPVEAWFLTSTEFVVVLDQRAVGAEPTRAKLQPLIGSWRGISYGNSQNKRQTGTYNTSTKRFSAVRERLVSSSSSYRGRSTLQGSYSLPSPTRMSVSGSYTTSPNPGGPNTIKYANGVPSFTAILTKTSRQPSREVANAFSDTRGR